LANEQTLIGDGADVVAEVGGNVVIGPGATVHAEAIENSVILPGASVQVSGRISGSFLGGTVNHEGDLIDAIVYDGDVR
jgi:carbonic anhydrase/acetyltransferase-like protein (isoleucine patch superfamily)